MTVAVSHLLFQDEDEDELAPMEASRQQEPVSLPIHPAAN